MVTFDLTMESYVKELLNNNLIPYEHKFFYINNFRPEYIDDEDSKNLYIVLFDEGSLQRLHPDFKESGTKAFFINIITPVIENEKSLKIFKEQLDNLSDNLRLNNVKLQDEYGADLFSVTTVTGDAQPVENVTQNGIRYLFNLQISAVYESLQIDDTRIEPIREEERTVEISLDNGATYKLVKGKLSFRKDITRDLNIFPTNGQKLAQNYLKQRRFTITMQVQRSKNNVTEELYQDYEDSIEPKTLRIRVKDYESDTQRVYEGKMVLAVESGEYALYDSLLFVFEISKKV